MGGILIFNISPLIFMDYHKADFWNWNWLEIKKYNQEEFKNWWNTIDVDYCEMRLEYLCKYCNNNFEIWWDPDKFNWLWFHYICKYCSKYFLIWWDPDEFNWVYIKSLKRHCSKHKDIWEKDYFIHKLKGNRNAL